MPRFSSGFCEVAYNRKDAAYRRAKQEGYRSRAAYKLIELDRRFKLFRHGYRVVDLGCWPGAWLQYASEKTGPSGRVVGVDLAESDPIGGKNVRILVGDVADPAVGAQVFEELGGPADVVLSDLAPKLSGVKPADAVRHADLVRVAIERARGWLQPDGALIVKLFMDAEYQGLISELRRTFKAVRSVKPDSTRQGSSELYTCARGLRGDGKSSAGSEN
ncbi:MAG: RlmE family RNA methyltransferase [Candidatus Binatia bacterium]|nr:RlmE family RNA methyltransferase [Candidatus Binatia bacterium]